MMDDPVNAFLAVTLAGIVLIVVLKIATSRSSSQSSTEENATERRSVGELTADVVVEVVGQAVPAVEALTGPLSQRRCLGWEITVEEYIVSELEVHFRENRREGNWRTILHEQEIRDFFVEDQTGRVLIRAGYPDLTLAKDQGYRSALFSDSPPEVVAFLKAHGQKPTTALGENRMLRYREGVLTEGERVQVTGVVRQELDSEAGAATGYRSSPTRLVIEKPPQEPLKVTDIVRR